jgi:hypothetical protein
MTSVDVYVLDSTALHQPIEGVSVRVFDAAGAVFQTQDTTDSDGHVGFTLPEATYSLRFYKFGVQVPQPQLAVVEAGALNTFNAYGVVFVHPISADARLCRASGYFRDISGAAHAWVDVMFLGAFDPIILEDAAVVSERRCIRSGRDGYACIDLIRGANYRATIQGFEDVQRTISVPDLPSCNLPDLLFPVVESISFTPNAPYTVTIGTPLVLVPTVVDSAGVPLRGIASGDVKWSSSDEAILSVSNLSDTELELRGVSPGTATLIAERWNTSIIRVPNTPITGVPQSVIVA